MEGAMGLDECLKMLEELLGRVKQTHQSKRMMDFPGNYRYTNAITQPRLLVGGQLKKYQLEALEWMIELAQRQSNGILADDMGLGKTIQAISYLAYLKEEHGILGKHLIVCPKSVAGNWARELAKWFPSAKVELMILNCQTRENFLNSVLRPRKFDIIITNYQGAKICINSLSRIKWESLIIDQAHKIKNNQSRNFECLNLLKTTFRLLLTGTPLNNNLKELWCLLNFIMPHIFTEEDMFSRIDETIKSLSKDDQSEQEEKKKLDFQCRVAKYFHKIISPFFKRRTKKELDLGLPQKKEMTLFVPFSKLQLRMYRNFLRFGNVRGNEPPSSFNIMTPRKICQHPYLFDGIEEEGEGFIEDSGKLIVLDKLVRKLLAEKHKILIFSQFVIMLELLEKYCRMRGYKYCKIDGNKTLEERDKDIHRFYNDPDYSIFLLSTRAGGLGLNLVAADRVIIYDIDWNPQNDLQATDRAYRIGQTKPVMVYRLITDSSIEQKMLNFQKYKLIWDELVIQKGALFGRTKEDPFSNIDYNKLSTLGKGDIYRLQAQYRDQSIEEILQIGEERNKQQEAEIREKLQKQLKLGQKISFVPEESEESDEEFATFAQDDQFVQRRNYDNEKRERAKFQRNRVLPPFKFYLQPQLIKDLEFEIHMETKREGAKNQKLLELLYVKLQQAQAMGRFHNWSEYEFERFISAHQIVNKKEYAKIAQHIGSKSAEEVKAYSEHFFEKAANNERLVNFLRDIQRMQAKLKKPNPQISENSVKIISKESSENANNSKKEGDQSSETSAATQGKKPKKRTKEEIQRDRQEKERIKLEREKKREEEKQAREMRRQEEIKKREENKLKREEEAKARQEAKLAKQQERIKRNEQREIKRQKDLEERQRKKIESQTKKQLQEAEKQKKEAENVMKQVQNAVKKKESEHSSSKRTEKSGGKEQQQNLVKTKGGKNRESKGKPHIATVTVHDD